jgi:hypothetical protein
MYDQIYNENAAGKRQFLPQKNTLPRRSERLKVKEFKNIFQLANVKLSTTKRIEHILKTFDINYEGSVRSLVLLRGDYWSPHRRPLSLVEEEVMGLLTMWSYTEYMLIYGYKDYDQSIASGLYRFKKYFGYNDEKISKLVVEFGLDNEGWGYLVV